MGSWWLRASHNAFHVCGQMSPEGCRGVVDQTKTPRGQRSLPVLPSRGAFRGREKLAEQLRSDKGVRSPPGVLGLLDQQIAQPGTDLLEEVEVVGRHGGILMRYKGGLGR